MLKNYITIAINNLFKNKLYSAINIAGLAIGLAACIIIALYVRDQTSYDKQWKDSDRIYRVNCSVEWPGREPIKWSAAPYPAMPALQKYFKDNFEQTARASSSELTISIGTDKFKSKWTQVDTSFIDIFQLEVIAGSLKDTLTNIANVALSEESAKRYFGRQDPIGEIITVATGGMKIDCKVTAVYRISGNTTVLDDMPIISLLPPENLIAQYLRGWGSCSFSTYIKLKKGINIETLRPLLPAMIDQTIPSDDPSKKTSDQFIMDFQRLDTAHLDSPWDTSSGNKTVVMSFAAISLLVLLIGCINFTILTTAKATQRAREVAMRKVVGAKRKQLIVQFLGESTFIVLLAMIFAMGLVELMLPIFESIVGKTLSFNYFSLNAILPLLVMLIIVAISGGLYPAFILSGYRPGDTLKANQSKETSWSMSLRSSLVTFQFSISIILIIAIGVIFIQTRYSLNRDPGYNKDNLLIINQMNRNEVKGKIEPFKKELLNLSNVSDVCFSMLQPSQLSQINIGFTHHGRPETQYIISRNDVGYDYFTTYQIPVVSGRNYSVERDLPDQGFEIMTGTTNDNEDKEPVERNIILNESAVRQLGFNNTEDAIGKIISISNSNNNYTIIGVVADNHIFSINAPPRPESYWLQPNNTAAVTVRYKGSRQKILEQVKSVWNKVMGDAEISYVFVDQILAGEFQREQTEMKVLISFSLLAILIACMGLFGSASFTVEKRTKEIGLRKVMGAKVKNIVTLLLWQFSKPVLIANIIAWPVAIFVMQYWLERFTYRFNSLLMIPICLASGLIALVIAWSTVAGNTRRVAKSKPIKALRYE